MLRKVRVSTIDKFVFTIEFIASLVGQVVGVVIKEYMYMYRYILYDITSSIVIRKHLCEISLSLDPKQPKTMIIFV